MGRLRNLIRRRRLLAAILLGIFALSAAGGLVLWRRGYLGALKAKLRALHNRLTVTEECVDAPRQTQICVVSEMAKLPPGGPVPREGWLFDATARRIGLQAARNEVVAFQVILKGSDDAPTTANVEVTDLEGPGGATLPATPNVTRYLARYVWVDPGGHSWGPPSKVLPWPALYPDALVPFRTACRISSPTGDRAVVPSFKIPHAEGPNQAVWIDIYVPRAQPPGRYRGKVAVTVGGQRAPLSLELEVHPPVLPDRPTLQAVGELYDPYQVEGIGKQVREARWQRMAQCYQQLAHRHRTVFIERLDDIEGFEVEGLDESDEAWEGYDRAFGPALSGALFTRQHGYVGPGEGIPLTVWRTPWVQRYNEVLKTPLTDEEVGRYEALARTFVGHFQKRGWTPYLFAYIFDEVVGPADTDSDEAVGRTRTAQDPAYVRMVHLQMKRVQQAIDRGAGARRVDLLWTSHVDPTTWAGKPGLDLVGTIRLWAPNAGAASPGFMQARAKAGEQAWFYHAGHPSVGVHAINASGIEMRTWGVVTARYGLGGQLMWAVNFGSAEAPYRKPSYKDDDDRFGNGTLVYPGRRLPNIGLPAIDEPVPSMRLKAWRRGLQDAELVTLARRAGRGAQVDKLLRQLVPRALAEGEGDAAWPTDSAAWHRFHLELLRLAAPR